MTTTLNEELNRLSNDYPELAKRLKEFLGDGRAISSVNTKPSLEARQRIFQHWASSFHKSRVKFKSGSKRDAKIVARLKSFDEKEILKAITGFAMDPWRHEELVRHELATLLRDDEKVEVGLDIHDKGGGNANIRGGFGSSNDGKANSTISYRREDTPRVPGHEDRGRDPMQHNTAQWTEVRWGGPVREEEDPF